MVGHKICFYGEMWLIIPELSLLLLLIWSSDIRTSKYNKFFICSKWKIYYFQVSQNLGTLQHQIIMCLNTGTPYNHHFHFGTNGKVVVLGVPILKHFRVLPLDISNTDISQYPLISKHIFRAYVVFFVTRGYQKVLSLRHFPHSDSTMLHT